MNLCMKQPCDIVEIKSSFDFQKMITSDTKHSQILMIYADWCGVCKNTFPIFKNEICKLVQQHNCSAIKDSHKVSLFTLNCGDKSCQDIVKVYNVTGFPTFIVFYPENPKTFQAITGRPQNMEQFFSDILSFIKKKY